MMNNVIAIKRGAVINAYDSIDYIWEDFSCLQFKKKELDLKKSDRYYKKKIYLLFCFFIAPHFLCQKYNTTFM